eukprot:Nk52_evm34s967 gene=Nk52_evmTU34s967
MTELSACAVFTSNEKDSGVSVRELKGQQGKPATCMSDLAKEVVSLKEQTDAFLTEIVEREKEAESVSKKKKPKLELDIDTLEGDYFEDPLLEED